MPTPLALAPVSARPDSAAGASPTSPARSPRSPRHPLLTLTPCALAPEEGPESPEEELTIKDIWTVVKDGERLENLAWRHWSQPNHDRRLSSSSAGTASDVSLPTPVHEHPPPLVRSKSYEKRTFGGMLKLLVEENEFRDWVEDAKRRLPPTPSSHGPAADKRAPPETPDMAPPTFSLPDTPVADVEIRLVEPTPVPSRVGSLGGSIGAGSLLARAAAPPKLAEEDEEELDETPSTGASSSSAHGTAPIRRSPRKRPNRFFIQSSPTKHSGSDSSQPSPVTVLSAELEPAPQPAECAPSQPSPPQLPEQEPALSDRRSSTGSSSAVMMKKKDGADGAAAKPRHVSIATMRGRFAGEKARAAEAIVKRNDDVKGKGRAVDQGQGSSDWEDDEDEDDDEGWEDESPEKPKAGGGAALRRTSSRSTRSGNSGLDLTRTLSGASAGHQPRQTSSTDRGKEKGKAAAAAVGQAPAKPMSKKERAAEKARLDAERDAQRKREMFAKQQIFGQVKPGSEGLLSNIFRSGKSMIDLTQAGQEKAAPLRRAPTHANLPLLSRSPAPAPVLLRSKSVAAMPVQTGVSVTATVQPQNHSDEKRKPAGIDMESDDESDDEDENYLASSQVRRKIEELAARRDKRSTPQPQAPPAAAQAVPLVDGVLDENGVVRPLSPTTRRRTMIMREMSESLRRNIILEREKSAGQATGFGHARAPSTTAQARIQTSSSAVDLQQAGADRAHAAGPLHRRTTDPLDRSASDLADATRLPRSGSHPELSSRAGLPSDGGVAPRAAPPSPLVPQHSGGSASAQASSHHAPAPQHPGLEPTRRRTTPNVLGGGFLRPLTRVGAEAAGGREGLSRTQSAANLSTSPREAFPAQPFGVGSPARHASPRQPPASSVSVGAPALAGPSGSLPRANSGGAPRPPMMPRAPSVLRMDATPMARSQTEGDERHVERMRLKRELAKRSETMDTSYRLHGW